jgi:hypothetical protein
VLGLPASTVRDLIERGDLRAVEVAGQQVVTAVELASFLSHLDAAR